MYNWHFLLNFRYLFPTTHSICPFQCPTNTTRQHIQSHIHLSLNHSAVLSSSVKGSTLHAIPRACYSILHLSPLQCCMVEAGLHSPQIPYFRSSSFHIRTHGVNSLPLILYLCRSFHHSGSQQVTFRPRVHLAMSWDIFAGTSGASTTGVQLVGARDADKHITIHSTVPTYTPNMKLPSP